MVLLLGELAHAIGEVQRAGEVIERERAGEVMVVPDFPPRVDLCPQGLGPLGIRLSKR